MKKLVFLILPLFLISTSIFGQKKKVKESSIFISGILNIDPEQIVRIYNYRAIQKLRTVSSFDEMVQKG